MFRFQRSGQVKNGKNLEAIGWAKEIAEYLNAKYSTSFQVYTEYFGDVNTIYWQSDFKDLATFESLSSQLLSDQGYWANVIKGMEWIIEGSLQDKLVHSV